MPAPFGGASTTQLDRDYSFRVGWETPTQKDRKQSIVKAFQKLNDLSALLSPNPGGPDFEGMGKQQMIKERKRNKENWMEKLRKHGNQSATIDAKELMGRNSGTNLTQDTSMYSLSKTLPPNINF